MTYAFNEIERDTAPAPTQCTARMQVFVVAPSEEIGTAVANSMAEDPMVDVHLTLGSLASLVLTGGLDWTACDFLIFHADGDVATTLAAIHCLKGKPDVGMHCIAMVDGPVREEVQARLMAAGVASVLSVPQRTAPDAPEVPSAPQRAAVRSRLHLTEPLAGAAGSAPDVAARVAPVLPAPGVSDGPAVGEDGVTTDRTGRITTVLRARGGAGASTLAVNLALEIVQSGEPRVALVDLDIQNGSVATLLDMADSGAMTALMRDGALPDAAFLDRAMVRHDSGIDVLSAPDIFVPMTALTPDMVAALMDALQQRYDRVIVDMPQAMLDWIEPVFERAAQALIVTDTSVPSIKRTRRLMDVLNEEHMTLTVEVVINKEKRPLLLTDSQKEAARLLGRRLDHWIPEDAARARKALDAGVPFQIGAARSKPARAVAGLRKALFPAKQSEDL